MSQNGQHLLQDFKSVSDHFGTLCIKGLKGNTEYKGMSITKDYRDKWSKNLLIKPRKKSPKPENSNFVWRVRGISKKRIGIKFFYESKGTTDYTKLIRTNTAYESQSYIPTEYKSSADKEMYTYQSSVRW